MYVQVPLFRGNPDPLLTQYDHDRDQKPHSKNQLDPFLFFHNLYENQTKFKIFKRPCGSLGNMKVDGILISQHSSTSSALQNGKNYRSDISCSFSSA